MPGFIFAYREGGAPPLRRTFPLAKSMNGTGTPPAAALKSGDLVAYSTLAALTTSAAKVVRPLLAADKTANYEAGGVRAGILGILGASDVSTSSSGSVAATTSFGGAILRTQGMASMNALDPNGHAQETFIIATSDTVFKAQLAVVPASVAAFLALKGGLGGITITTTVGVSVYTVNITDTGEQLMLNIVDVDESDITMKTVFVKILNTGLTPSGSYCQIDTATAYTAQ